MDAPTKVRKTVLNKKLTQVADLRLGLVGGAPLQRDLQHAVVQTHEERPVAVQDLQAQDRLPHTRREELQLLQVTTLQVLIGRGQRLQDGAVF